MISEFSIFVNWKRHAKGQHYGGIHQLKMEGRQEQWSKQEVRTVIGFLNAKQVLGVEFYPQLVEVYRNGIVSRQRVENDV